jgi:two-component system chemotaxis response regulator CheB
MNPIRVLVVDDSATMRGLIAATLSRDPAISIVGEAADPYQAREAIKALNPDVMTLDVEMPRMSGIDFLEKVMSLRPLPVVMVSTTTERGTATTIRAMEIGAVDCVAKPSPATPNTFDELAGKIKSAALARVGRTVQSQRQQHQARQETSYVPDGKVVAIGASTGGVEALLDIISQYPANCPPTLVTLHMPAQFTKSFAQRLDRDSAASVTEAADGVPIQAGHVYIAPGTHTHLEIAGGARPICKLRRSDPVSGHRPSVDVMFHSAAASMGAKAVGVILTGMGRDGADGLLAMRRAGARTVGQDEASSIVYGMPRVAFQNGAVEKQVALPKIAAEILAMTSAGKTRI